MALRKLIFPLLTAAALWGCDRPPSGTPMREWSAEDHDHGDDRSKVLSGGSTGPKQKAPKDGGLDPAIVELTWQKQCANCHGREGRGDGPQGPMFKARGLTREDWRAATTDEAIMQTISGGKGAMPKFDLAPEVLRGLVARIRAGRTTK